MLVVLFDKTEFLRMLPKGGRWAEIGVFRGDFSETILRECKPRELHLIDPWQFDLDFDWFAPPEFSAIRFPSGPACRPAPISISISRRSTKTPRPASPTIRE
jgi:hypothetical protein